jgi:hypothetical protein
MLRWDRMNLRSNVFSFNPSSALSFDFLLLIDQARQLIDGWLGSVTINLKFSIDVFSIDILDWRDGNSTCFVKSV